MLEPVSEANEILRALGYKEDEAQVVAFGDVGILRGSLVATKVGRPEELLSAIRRLPTRESRREGRER